MEKNYSQPSFVEVLVAHRKTRNKFLGQIDALLDWEAIDTTIKKFYDKGLSADGRPSYTGLVLFKMSLLQYWYNLSDYEVEEQCNDSISFSKFVGIPLEESIPDNTVISRFRTVLTKANAYDALFEEINRQLTQHGLLLNTGSIVDASITSAPRRPRGKKEYEIVEDRKEDLKKIGSATDNKKPSETPPDPNLTSDTTIKNKLAVKEQKGVDKEAAWIKKGNKLLYGYKKHVGTDEQGMVQAITTTAANESDTKNLTPVLDKAKLKRGAWVKADKAYRSKDNVAALQERDLKSHLMHKAQKNKPLTARQKIANKLISKVRYKVERTFGSMKRWSGAGVARYVGQAKMHTQHVMEAITHNLYRSPNLYMLNQIQKSIPKGIPMLGK